MPDNRMSVRCIAAIDPMVDVNTLPVLLAVLTCSCLQLIFRLVKSPRQFKDNNKPYVTYYVLDTNGKLERQVRSERNLTSAIEVHKLSPQVGILGRTFAGSEPC